MMEFAAPRRVPRHARKPLAAPQSMNGGMNSETAPSTTQIMSAATKAGAPKTARGCESALGVLPGS